MEPFSSILTLIVQVLQLSNNKVHRNKDAIVMTFSYEQTELQICKAWLIHYTSC